MLNGVTGSVIVPRSGLLVAALGLDDLVVTDTPDAVLACHRDGAQDVKLIVEQLRQRGDTRV